MTNVDANDVKSMKVDQLRELARQFGIENPGQMRKPELKEALIARLKANLLIDGTKREQGTFRTENTAFEKKKEMETGDAGKRQEQANLRRLKKAFPLQRWKRALQKWKTTVIRSHRRYQL